ncbi:MAG: hypothetical protein IT380_06370 [Myxococcales bacterium]|nr:hypothetical protein [Myxococcales bacterium]
MLITPPLFALAFSLGQLTVSFDVEQYYTSSCSTSERTGYVPFVARLTCAAHSGMDGCVASGRVDLSAQLYHPTYGIAYRYMCDREIPEGPVAVEDAEVEISGLKYDLTRTGPDTFYQVKILVEKTHYDPATHVLDWRAVVNWKRAPVTMVEEFTAEIFGEIVWTTNEVSQLVRGSGSCLTPNATACTAVATQMTWPAGWIYGGTALRGIEIESQSTQAILPTNISADLGEVIKSTGAKIAWECGLANGATPVPGLACGYSSLTIVGDKSEVFRAWVGPFAHGSMPPVVQSFTTPFYPRSATRCGLRNFAATSGGVSGTTDALWIGAHSVDCGWSPGNVYNGVGFHGFEADWTSQPKVEFSLDATRLP